MRLLITRHDKIGDFVLTLPMIKLAKEQIKEVKIIVLVSKVNFEFAKSIDFIDEVILYEKNPLLLAKKIKEKNIDIAISAFTDTRLAFALLLARIKVRVAPATKIAQIFANRRIVQRRSQVRMREFEYNIELLRAVFSYVSKDFARPLLQFKKEDSLLVFEDFKKQFNITQEVRFVVFHAGFGGSGEVNLSAQEYLELAKSISHKDGLKILFTFGPDDHETFTYIDKHLDFDAILYRSNLTLIDFCKLLSHCELFISASTGPMHLAGALNIKTLSFFGASLFASPKRWGGVNDENKQIYFTIPASTASPMKDIKAKLQETLNA